MWLNFNAIGEYVSASQFKYYLSLFIFQFFFLLDSMIANKYTPVLKWKDTTEKPLIELQHWKLFVSLSVYVSTCVYIELPEHHERKR